LTTLGGVRYSIRVEIAEFVLPMINQDEDDPLTDGSQGPAPTRCAKGKDQAHGLDLSLARSKTMEVSSHLGR